MILCHHELIFGAQKNERALPLEEFFKLDQIYFPNPWTLESWRKLLFESSSEIYLSWLSDSNDRILGVLVYLLNLEDSFAHLVKVFVTDGAKRCGRARDLIHNSHTALKRLAVSRYFLEVEATNSAAIALYQHFSYAQIHRRADFYGPGRDALIMERSD